MIFIETPIFTEDVRTLLSDEEYAQFQQYLVATPDAGALITQTGGLRKVRWAVQGRGKSAGVRVIYYHVTADAQIRLILIYKKGVKDSLSAAEKAVLKKLNERWV